MVQASLLVEMDEWAMLVKEPISAASVGQVDAALAIPNGNGTTNAALFGPC